MGKAKVATGRRGRPSTLETMLGRTDVTGLVTGAKAQLAKAVAAVRTASVKAGPLYGAVVRGVGTCLDIGMRTQDIAQVIASAWGDESQVSKGIAARYIVLARYQRGQYRKNEHAPVERNVPVNGSKFRDPLAALDSGTVTFTAVYKAWTAACQVRVQRAQPPASGFDSAIVEMARFQVPITVTGEDGEPEVKRVKVTADMDAFVGAMAALLASPVGLQLTTAKQRRDILTALSVTPKLSEHVHGQVLRVLPQAA